MQAEVAKEINGNEVDIENFIFGYVRDFAGRTADSSKLQIKKALQKAVEKDEDLVGAVEKKFDEFDDQRKKGRAKDEMIRTEGAITTFVFKQNRIVKKRWVAFGSSCPYCNGLSGRIVGIDEYFVEKGEDFEATGPKGMPVKAYSTCGHQPAHSGCDCSIVRGD